MTLRKLHEMGLVNDRTMVSVYDGENDNPLARGEWYTDKVLDYMSHGIEEFMWDEDDEIYIILRKENQI